MTVFNAEAYLASSIESIQKQTFSDWEMVIVDDASTDHSLAIAESYAQQDPRIHIIRNAINKGQTRCLNQGLLETRGTWIARQDADDLSHPTRLEKQWQRMQQEPALALLGTCGDMIDHKGNIIGLLDVPLTNKVIVASAAIKNPFLHTAVMFRATIVKALGGYEEQYHIAQDYDLWMRLMKQYQVANLEDRLISYRHLESSLSKVGKNKAFEEANDIAQRGECSSFGRALSISERLLVQAFREGEGVFQQELLAFFKESQRAFSEKEKKDWRRLQAAYCLQSAGNKKRNFYDAIKQVITAFLVAPFYTAAWMKYRFLSISSTLSSRLFTNMV